MSILNLYQFETKRAKIVDCDGIEYIGRVLLVYFLDDKDVHEILVDIEVDDGPIYGLLEHEIKSIELID